MSRDQQAPEEGALEQRAMYDLEAEQSVLGEMIANRSAAAEAIYLLRPEDFFKPLHQNLFTHLRAMFLDGQELDPIVVKDRMVQAGDHPDPSALRLFLVDLLGMASGVEQVSGKCGIILRFAHARTLAEIVEETFRDGTDEALERAGAQAQDLIARMQKQSSAERPVAVGDDLGAILTELERRSESGEPTGLLTGIGRLDEKTGGFKDGQLIIVGARPGMGKTGGLVQFTRSFARRGKKSAVFSYEMSTEEVRHRYLSQESGVPLWKFGAAKLSGEDFSRLADASERMRDHLVIIDGRVDQSPIDIAMEARRLKSEGGLDAIIIDYLQLVKPPRAHDSRQQEVSDISRLLKLTARELGIPVIVASQLNRQLEYRKDKRPMLADLRESGSLEQDADLVIFLYRDEVYHDDAVPGEAELHLAKHRNGPTGKLKLTWRPETAQFSTSKYMFGEDEAIPPSVVGAV